MLLEELFASIRQHYGCSTRQSADGEGVEITRRLYELLELEKPIETSPAEVPVKKPSPV
jgi:hypothetical protein